MDAAGGTPAMSKTVRILGIAGSLRRESYNRGALRAAQQLIPEGATLDVFELDGIPGFNQDQEQNPPEKVAELKRRIVEADAILFVTPEYNYSVPGVLKNAIDWASRPYGESAEWKTSRNHGCVDRRNRHCPCAVSPPADHGFPEHVSAQSA
jgi:NAD(P)H-dependent FMN reductase